MHTHQRGHSKKSSAQAARRLAHAAPADDRLSQHTCTSQVVSSMHALLPLKGSLYAQAAEASLARTFPALPYLASSSFLNP